MPKENSVAVDGLLSTRLSQDGWKKYKGKFGNTRAEIMHGLDESVPGMKRSMSISVLTSPVPDYADPDIRAFTDRSRLYRISAPELLAAGVIKHVAEVKTGLPPSAVVIDNVRKHNWRPPAWRKIKAGRYLFSNVPHYFIELKDGKVPPEFVEEI